MLECIIEEYWIETQILKREISLNLANMTDFKWKHFFQFFRIISFKVLYKYGKTCYKAWMTLIGVSIKD